jgi:adenylate kinase family enzyme
MAQQIPPLREVVDHYRATGVLRTIDGLRPIDEVTAELLAATDRELGAV